jgi:hypothetical protein
MLAVEKLAQGLIARTVAAATGIRREMEIMVLDRAPTFPPKALLSPAGRPGGEGVRRRAQNIENIFFCSPFSDARLRFRKETSYRGRSRSALNSFQVAGHRSFSLGRELGLRSTPHCAVPYRASHGHQEKMSNPDWLGDAAKAAIELRRIKLGRPVINWKEILERSATLCVPLRSPAVRSCGMQLLKTSLGGQENDG